MIDPRSTEIGVGITVAADGTVYEGRSTRPVAPMCAARSGAMAQRAVNGGITIATHG